MVRVPKTVSLEYLVGGKSVDKGKIIGRDAEKFLADFERQVSAMETASLKTHLEKREGIMDSFEAFRGSRLYQYDRPKDPKCADVGMINVEVVHGSGTLRIDLNTLGFVARAGGLKALEALPNIQSVISGAPGVLVRTDEAQFGLTPAEVDRLATLSLKPNEFFAICDAVGCIYLTHDDFYDPETGSAIQPRS